jgi:glycosyltransferase involved in cell wall biosynthesis
MISCLLAVRSLSSLKIAHICGPLLQPAGVERSTVELAYEMMRLGVDARIYTPFVRDNLFGGMCRTVDVQEVRVPILPVFEMYYDLLVTKRLISEASSWADVLILHRCHAVASYAMRRFLKPCIPFYHVDKWDWRIFGPLRAIAPIYTRPLISLELRSLREIPLVFATSRGLASIIRRHEPNARVVPITIGVDTSKFYPRWGKDDEFIMMTGRVHPINNFEIGISAMANTGFKMIIAGIVEAKFLSYYKRLRELVSHDDGLKERVMFKTLPEAALIEYLQSCSLFLSPRNFDYLGHAALEPMACGKPVIQLMTGSRLEDDPPVVFCNKDPNNWRDVVQTLMKDPRTRRDLGRKSYEFVQEKHSLRASVNQVLEYATQLLEHYGEKNGLGTARQQKK